METLFELCKRTLDNMEILIRKIKNNGVAVIFNNFPVVLTDSVDKIL